MGRNKIDLKKFPAGGYQGKLLRINLSKKMVSEESINPDLLHEFIGGTGLVELNHVALQEPFLLGLYKFASFKCPPLKAWISLLWAESIPSKRS